MVFLLLKFQIYGNMCDDHHSSVLCSLDVQFNKHATVYSSCILMQLHVVTPLKDDRNFIPRLLFRDIGLHV